jgi:hypothetical protein
MGHNLKVKIVKIFEVQVANHVLVIITAQNTKAASRSDAALFKTQGLLKGQKGPVIELLVRKG